MAINDLSIKSPMNDAAEEATNLDEVQFNRSNNPAQPVNGPEYAIQVQDLNLSFGGKKKVDVLNSLSMDVPRGCIYGLLGPSGCGKTSLIRCIVGSVVPTSGSVKVFGQQPGSSHALVPGAGLGYMPQDISLYSFLTIGETLQYFGKLYSLSEAQCQEQIDFLVQFLALPDVSRPVGVLSGGQKRRVSLAAALIHKPPLLILDEPTVGVDPLLRESIWRYLVQLSQNDHLTVLITTHYIEEAKDADQIGLMRKGEILEQDNPGSLLNRYRMASLEQIFLSICMAQEAKNNQVQPADVQLEAVEVLSVASSELLSRRESTSSESSGVASIPESINKNSVLEAPSSNRKPIAQSNSTNIWGQFGAMCMKNSKNLYRNPPSMLFQFVLPAIEIILFCLCIGLNVHSIPVAIFDGDRSNLSSRILNELNPKTIRQQFYSSEQDAIDAVRNGSAACALALHSNFSHNLNDRLMFLGDVSNETLYNSTIHLFPDMSNPLMVGAVHREALRAFILIGKQYLSELGISPNLLEIPVRIQAPIYGHQEPQFSEYMAPGVILSIAFLAAVPLTTINLVMERKDGMIERTLVAGVDHFLILLSHLLTQAMILVVQVSSLMLAIFLLFKIPFHGEVVEIMLLTILQSMCGMSFGLFVSSVSDSANTATMLSLGVFYPMLLLSGTVWPTEAMDPYLRYFSLCLPQTIPIDSMRHMVARGWSVTTHMDVLSGFGVSVAWIAIFLLLSTIIFRYRKI